MDGMIKFEDIYLMMDDERLSEKYNLVYTTELSTDVVEREDGNKIFYLKLKKKGDDFDSTIISIALDTDMVEQLCANLNLFLLAEMMR